MIQVILIPVFSDFIIENIDLDIALKEAEICHGWSPFIPPFEFTTDNAAMIAIVGHLKYLNNNYADQTVMATARLKL